VGARGIVFTTRRGIDLRWRGWWWCLRQDHRRAIADLAAAGFAAAISRGRWDWASRFAEDALAPNDEKRDS
jgi:hypothetical protein